jgi:hypothetical protein
MLLGLTALVLATLFTGAAVYVSLVEHPARLALDGSPLLAQWKLSYKRAAPIQAGLAALGGAAALIAWYLSKDWRWLVGGLALLANWPFTLIAIAPTNHRLMSMQPDEAGPESRTLLVRWGRLHLVRSALGAVAALLFVCGLVAG